MKIYQLYYTSCRRGLNAAGGFQTYAMSEGLSQEERREIEKQIAYLPPDDLPTQPTPAEIHAHFPVNLCFWRLKSGRYVIAQSVYVGLDYTRRYGNFFCHALILDQGHWPVLPILFWGSPFFKRALSEAENQADQSPAPLPVLTDLPETGPLELTQISRFLEAGTRMTTFKALLNACLVYPEQQRRLVLAAPNAEIPFWVLALQGALPIQLAHQLSFTTYTHDPATHPALLCATPRTGGRFAFSPTQRDHQYFIFDLIQQDFSSLSQRFALTDWAETDYRAQRKEAHAFQLFWNQIHYERLDAQLDTALVLMRLTQNPHVQGFTETQFLAALDFAGKYAQPSALSALNQTFQQRFQDPSQPPYPPALQQALAVFFFRLARLTQQAQETEQACQFLWRCLLNASAVLQSNPPELLAVLALYAPNSAELVLAMLSPTQLQELLRYLQYHPAQAPDLWFQVQNLAKRWDPDGSSLPGQIPGWSGFVSACASALWHASAWESLPQVLAQSPPGYTCQLLPTLWGHARQAETETQQKLLKVLLQWLTQHPSANQQVLSWAAQQGLEDWVYAIFVNLLSQTSQPVTVFWNHYQLMQAVPSYRQHYLEAALQQLLARHLPLDLATCFQLLHVTQTLPTSTLTGMLLPAFEQAVPLALPSMDVYTQLMQVLQLQARLDSTPLPSCQAVCLLAQLQHLPAQADAQAIWFGILQRLPAVTSLPAVKQVAYLRLLLPYLVSFISTAQEHHQIFERLSAGGTWSQPVSVTYAEGMITGLKQDPQAQKKRLFLFIQFALETPVFAHTPERVLQVLWPFRKLLTQLNAQVQLLYAQQPSIQQRWSTWLHTLEKQQPSLVKKVSQFFWKGFSN